MGGCQTKEQQSFDDIDSKSNANHDNGWVSTRSTPKKGTRIPHNTKASSKSDTHLSDLDDETAFNKSSKSISKTSNEGNKFNHYETKTSTQSGKRETKPPYYTGTNQNNKRTFKIRPETQNHKGNEAALARHVRRSDRSKTSNDVIDIVRRLESELQTVKDSERQVKKENGDLRKENSRVVERVRYLEENLDKIELERRRISLDYNTVKKQLEDMVKKSTEQIKTLQANVADLTDRLAAEMNKKISANETSLENIAIKCRPMNIADDFNNFVSSDWLEAKQVLDGSRIGEEKSVRFLTDTMMISASVASEIFAEGIGTLEKIYGLQFTSKSKEKRNELDGQDLDDVLSVIGDRFRRQVDNIDITPLKKKICMHLSDTTRKRYFPEIPKLLKNKDISNYLEESAFLAWKMAIQRPPMIFTQPDIGQKYQGEKIHPLAWGSKPSSSSKVKYYIYPNLVHGDSIMVRGKVFVS